MRLYHNVKPVYHIHGIGYRTARSGILGVAIGIDYQLLTGQYEAHLLATALHENGVPVGHVLYHGRKAQCAAVRLDGTVGVGLDVARCPYILGDTQSHSSVVGCCSVVGRSVTVLHKTVAGVVGADDGYLYLAAVGTGCLHALVGVLVAPAAKVDGKQLACGLADVKKTAVNGNLIVLGLAHATAGGTHHEHIMLRVFGQSLLYRVGGASVHHFLAKALLRALGDVVHGDFHGRVGIVALVARHIHRLCLEEFQRAVAAVAPACCHYRRVIVSKALVLLYHHHGGMQYIALHTARHILTLYADRVCSMRQSARVDEHVMRIGVGNGRCGQHLPLTCLVYLHLHQNTLVAGIVRKLVQGDVLCHAANLKAGVLGVVQRLHAHTGDINGNQADVLCGGVASIIGNLCLQRQFSSLRAKAAQVKFKRVVGQRGTARLLRLKRGHYFLCGPVHKVHAHDRVARLVAACLGDTHDGCLHHKTAACIGIQGVLLERYGNGSTRAATASCTYRKLHLVAYHVTCRVLHVEFDSALGLCINSECGRDMGIRSTC